MGPRSESSVLSVEVGSTMGMARAEMERTGRAWALVVDAGVVMGLVTSAQAAAADADSPAPAGRPDSEATLSWFDGGSASSSARLAA